MKETSIRDILVSLLDSQCLKGVNTYGHTLDDCPAEKFDWRLMALEELLDACQYLIKQNKELQKQINNLEIHNSQLQRLKLRACSGGCHLE